MAPSILHGWNVWPYPAPPIASGTDHELPTHLPNSEHPPSLDDTALFLAVADASGLAGAARATGVPVPTLSRRMAALEARLGRHLFQRGPRGYALTADGRALLAEAEPLRAASARLRAFAGRVVTPRVRITAGLWTSRFLAGNLARIWEPGAGWVPEFLASNVTLDIARREADIGIRNHRPEQSWLAGRCTSEITYAVYGTAPGVTGYVALPDGPEAPPSVRWLHRTHGDEIVTTASDPRLALDLALAGLGRIVLPCFAGDAVPDLTRFGPAIPELTHEEWLVCHHDGRHDPPVRQALEALAGVLSDPGLRPAA